MSDTKNDLLIEEVDDEVRRARLNAFWKAWGKYIVGLAVLIVAVVAGRQYWMNKVISDQEVASDAYEAVASTVEAGEGDPAGSWAASLDGAPDGYKSLGAFRLAAAELDNGNIAGAIAAFDRIANESEDPEFQAIANLQVASLLIQQGDFAAARGRAGLLRGSESVWDAPASEIVALADLQEGNLEQALEGYRTLNSNPNLPATMRQRVSQMVDYVESLTKTAAEPEAAEEAAPVESEETPAAEGN